MRCNRTLMYSTIGVLLFSPVFSQAQQLWTNIISPGRAVNWSNAGIPAGIPNRATQCGATIAPYSGSAAAINNAIAACPAGDFVSLGAGTFNLTTGVDFTQHSNVTLRGQGANSTFLSFSGGGAGGYNSDVALEGSVSGNGFENNVCDWTGGYTPSTSGSSVITLANCGSTTPSAGSLSNLKVGTLLILDQVDEASDTGTIWNCATQNSCANGIQGGEARTDGPSVNGVSLRSQQQGVVVTAVNGNSVTVSPGVYMPNWRSGQAPQAWFANVTATSDGIENLSIDNTPAGAASGQNITISNCVGCWVKGVRSIDANRSHVHIFLGSHTVVRDSYFYENVSHQTVSYGAEMMGAWDGVMENNIFQQDTDSEPSCSGACEGNVVDYNYDINNVFTTATWFQAGFYQHSSGDSLNLWEGNIGPGYNSDDVHGTHHFETLYRNVLLGNQANCDGAPCADQTIPIQMYVGSRYFNIVGNVLGQPGYHTNYTCNAQSTATCSQGNTSIYTMGYSGNGGGNFTNVAGYCTSPSCGSHSYYDPQVATYSMRWGNYDTVTGGVRWCGSSSDTGWSSTCGGASEVPTSIASYPNSVPSLGDQSAGQSVMPASFIYSTKPSFWQGGAWPPAGPDVSNGNLGICSGGSYPGVLGSKSSDCSGGSLVTYAAGHANSNPAMECYLHVMNGAPDGSGSVLNFNAASCYGAEAAPPAPTGLTGNVVTTN